MNGLIGLMLTLFVLGTRITPCFPLARYMENTNPEYTVWTIDTSITVNETFPSRHERAADTDELPNEMDIDLPMGTDKDTVRLHLQRNKLINDAVTVTVQRHGKIVYQRFPHEKNIGYYQDVVRGSAFMVERNSSEEREAKMYSFFGEIFQDNETYLVQPPDNTHKRHTVSRLSEGRPVVGDYLLPPDVGSNVTETVRNRGRQRRGTETTKYEVELLLVTDYEIYMS